MRGDPVVGYVAPVGAQLLAQRIAAPRTSEHRPFDVRRVVLDAAARPGIAK